MNSHDLTISGVKLKFPNKPYPCQISMMQQIIKGLQKKENCLLESPTGSGKTLSLLCSALAWQKFEKQEILKSANEHYELMEQKLRESCYCDCQAKRVQMSKRSKPRKIGYEDENGIVLSDEEKDWEISKNNTNSNEPVDGCACVCHGTYNEENPVFKSKKTHKQIANVIKEFKKSPYANDTRMTILSSRSHTCIHPQVSKMPNKDEGCKKLNKKGQSILEMNQNAELSNDTMNNDFDTTDTAMQHGVSCSFNQKLKAKPMVYESYGFKQSVWDIEELITVLKRKRMCPYYAARDLTNFVDIIFCPYNYLIDPKIRASMSIGLDEQIIIIDEAHNIEDSSRDAASILITKHQIEQALNDLNKILNGNIYKKQINDEGMVEVPSQEDLNVCRFFVGIFSKLVEWIELNSMNMTPYNFDDSISKTWNGLEMVSQFKMLGIGPEKYELIRVSSVNKLRPENPELEFASDIVKMVADRLCLVMEFLYMEDHIYMDDYKVVIIKSKFVNSANQSEEEPLVQQSQFRKTQAKLPEYNFTINFWCLNPAVAFYYFRKCHSVILCSGTLSPMDSFQTELDAPFPLKLEANHVITDRQVWVGCVGTGPTNVKLQVTHKEVETFGFQDEVGRLILDICKSMPYGILCFFPSFSLLKKLLLRWQDSGLTKKIEGFKKIFSETKFSEKLLTDYYECVDNGKSNEGALLLAVYRGKCSEGLDFSNNYARAVIAFGIPFPNIMDTQVKLKKEYNDFKSKKKNVLNGNEWYEIQAYRALNQALGRCIRHREDWGAIILVDDRYSKQPEKYSKGLSKWIRTKFRTFKSYNEAYKSLTQFGTDLKDFTGSFHPLPTQENALSQIDSTFNSKTTISPREVKPLLLKEKVQLKNIDKNEIENFMNKYPQIIPFIREEFLSDEVKVKINLQKMSTLQINTPVQKESLSVHSIFSSSHKKRSRENNDDYETTKPRNILGDNNAQKKIVSAASTSIIDLNDFKHKTNKYTFSKDTKVTENDPTIVETLNSTIELVDSDDDEYDYKVIKQNKRVSLLEISKQNEVIDVVERGENKNDDDCQLDFDLSPDNILEKKKKPKKTNLQLLMDS